MKTWFLNCFIKKWFHTFLYHFKWNLNENTAMAIQKECIWQWLLQKSPTLFRLQFVNQFIPTGPHKSNFSSVIADYPWCVGRFTTVLMVHMYINPLRPSDTCVTGLIIMSSDNDWPSPSQYLNQCWNIINWILGNKLLSNLNRNSYVFIQENTFENVVWKMAAILFRAQCVKTVIPWYYLWCHPLMYTCAQLFTYRLKNITEDPSRFVKIVGLVIDLQLLRCKFITKYLVYTKSMFYCKICMLLSNKTFAVCYCSRNIIESTTIAYILVCSHQVCISCAISCFAT